MRWPAPTCSDGYVKPEIALDDVSGPRRILRVQVHEAQVTNVIFEGDLGRSRDALERIGARLENTRPLRKDDVPEALRDMRQIAGLAVTATHAARLAGLAMPSSSSCRRTSRRSTAWCA